MENFHSSFFHYASGLILERITVANYGKLNDENLKSGMLPLGNFPNVQHASNPLTLPVTQCNTDKQHQPDIIVIHERFEAGITLTAGNLFLLMDKQGARQ